MSRKKTPRVPAPTRFTRRSDPGVESAAEARARRVARRASTKAATQQTRFEVAITTYDRPDDLLRLLQDIVLSGNGLDVHVRVYDDCSPSDYSQVEAFLARQGWEYFRSQARGGKREFWQLVDHALSGFTNLADGQCSFVLQDDMRLCSDFFRKSLAVWETIPGKKATLYLLKDDLRSEPGTVCWTGVPFVVQGHVERTQWVDLNAFLISGEALRAIESSVHRVDPARWETNPDLSSGVGQQISVRLHQLRWSLFRVRQSLVLHLRVPSYMNPEVRKESPLVALNFIDGAEEEARIMQSTDRVTASLATIPSRRKSLKKVVARLLPQVDQLNVYLNQTPAVGTPDYPHLPEYLKHPKIQAVWSQDTEYGDRGDAGKFFWSQDTLGYHVITDDDVLYPADFVSKLLEGVERHGRRAVVGFHGAILLEPFHSYYRCREVHHFTKRVPRDVPVHVIASNSLCYHSSTIELHRDDFELPNMGDIWLAVQAQKQSVPLICLQHSEGWLRDDEGTREDSIYAHSTKKEKSQKNTADVQTRVVRESGSWALRGSNGQELGRILT